MNLSREKAVISHHCMGRIEAWKSDARFWLSCFEDDAGKLVLTDDQSLEWVVLFCPFCGKESKAHAEAKDNAVQKSS